MESHRRRRRRQRAAPAVCAKRNAAQNQVSVRARESWLLFYFISIFSGAVSNITTAAAAAATNRTEHAHAQVVEKQTFPLLSLCPLARGLSQQLVATREETHKSLLLD